MQRIGLKVPEVAPLVGMTANNMRKLLRQGKLPYGKAILTKEYPDGRKRFEYIIYLPKLLEETGLKKWPGGAV